MTVDISDWVWDKIPDRIGLKPIDSDIFVRDIIIQMLMYIQETMVEFYLPSYKIKSISIKLFELNAQLKVVCGPDEMFTIWHILDKSITKLKGEALTAECYEGIINLQKLKEMI